MGNGIMQVLIVEDSENDTVLLLEELEQKGHAPAHQRVETKEDFLAALQNGSWDAVISDYVLPQFSGPDALKLLRNQGFDIPFIMVSGVHGEETAVAMMKAGANDYIVKGNLSRLARRWNANWRRHETAACTNARKARCSISPPSSSPAKMPFMARTSTASS